MDGNGRGFSFADLAADRAGIQFATMAMDNNGGAHYIQSLLSKADTGQSFFPDIFGLQENLGLSTFQYEYRDIDSKAYKDIVIEIDRRIKRLPLFSEQRKKQFIEGKKNHRIAVVF